MLGKLLKYDLKYLLSDLYIFYILSVLVSLFTCIFEIKYDDTNYIYVTTEGFVNIIYLAVNTLLIGYVILKIIKRFKDNIYSDEGYLTNTLPVSKNDILRSKYLSTIITILITMVILFINYILGMEYDIFTGKTCLIVFNNSDYFYCIGSLLYEKVRMIAKVGNISKITSFIYLIFMFILLSLNLISSCYLGIIHTSKKSENKLMSIVWSVFNIVVSMIIFYIVFKILYVTNADINYIFNFKEEIENLDIKYAGAYRLILLISILIPFLNNFVLYLLSKYKFNEGINLA